MAAAPDRLPALSVVIPTFNNEKVLRECLDGWQRFGGDEREIIVVEDGCRDGTAAFLDTLAATPWGSRHLRWIHQDDAHELRANVCRRRLRRDLGSFARLFRCHAPSRGPASAAQEVRFFPTSIRTQNQSAGATTCSSKRYGAPRHVTYRCLLQSTA
jgi:cellulose synthase/poly-beta-1,6-N-acetylglucosamine synthase-like glycosyltransferase